jgi:hypothetical protein
MLLISKTLKTGDQGVKDLFENLQGQFDGVDEFLEALDCLYALGRVELMQDRRTLHYVKRD